MSGADDYDYDDYSEYVDCWQCGGEGGWNSCMEDTCCALGGEEGCNDPTCWRRCDICKGEGGWTREEPAPTPPLTDEAKAAAVAMREFISGVIERYAEGCDANEDKEAGRVAAHVARSIGRLVEIIPPGAVVAKGQSET